MAAKSMVAKLKKSKRAPIIVETERLCIAYVDLANFNVDKYKGRSGGTVVSNHPLTDL